MHNWIALSAETPGVLRDECGVPVEWTLLREGENPLTRDELVSSICANFSSRRTKRLQIAPAEGILWK